MAVMHAKMLPPPLSCALAAADARVAWSACGLLVCSALHLLLSLLFLAFPAHFPLLRFTRTYGSQLLAFCVGLLVFVACFPGAAHAKTPGFRTRALTAAELCFSSARILLLYIQTCSRPHPCWGLVVTFGAMINLPLVFVVLKAAAGYDMHFWRELRLSAALAGILQILRSLLILAILGGDDPVFPPENRSFLGSVAIGGSLLLVALVLTPPFRLALSNACGIASLYALRLADMCQPDEPLETEHSRDSESTEISESEEDCVPTVLTTFPAHEVQLHPPYYRPSKCDSGSLGSLASSDDFATSKDLWPREMTLRLAPSLYLAKARQRGV
ncbi:MAG: hypothetical protein SGPRY_011976 [Prymnesium sp.]